MLRLLVITTFIVFGAGCKTPQPTHDAADPQPQALPLTTVVPQPAPVATDETDEDFTRNKELEVLDCRTDGCDLEESCVPRREIDCTQTEGCKTHGLCSVISAAADLRIGEYLCTDWQEAVCGAVKDSDCTGSLACKEGGFCEAGSYRSYYNKCGSENEEDCFEWVTNVCMVTADGCSFSKECAERGNCGVQEMHWGSTCRPRDESHCQNSERCRIAGECGLVVESGSWCAPTLHAHCEASEACKTDGFCVMKGGYCVADDKASGL